MEVKDIEKKWQELEGESKTSYTTIRIDGVCVPDLFLGISKENNRCLILEVPKSVKVDFKQPNTKNLKAVYRKDKHCIILELLDQFYHELFNDLILSMYNALKDEQSPEKSTKLFIITVNKWSAFLSGLSKSELSEREIRGMIGELVYLNHCLENSDAEAVNSILDSWCGPYDETYDFEFDDKAVEVKAIVHGSLEARISNEFQLDPIPGKEIHFVTVSLDANKAGKNIAQIIDFLRTKILATGGDLAIFFLALSEKNLNPDTFKLYDHYRYKIPNYRIYDAQNNSFPALRRSDLNESIRKVQYRLNLEQCDDFLISTNNTVLNEY